MTLLKRKTEESIKVTRRWERRFKQLLDNLKEKRGYWKLKEEALDPTLFGTRFGRGYRISCQRKVMPMCGLAPVAVKKQKQRRLLVITCTQSLKKYLSKKHFKICRDRRIVFKSGYAKLLYKWHARSPIPYQIL
jgi:hypothetical protein